MIARVSQTFLTYFPAGSIKQRFAHHTLWSTLGSVASQTANLLGSIILSRMLGKATFGELGMINSTIGTIGLLAGISLASTSTKYIAEYRSENPERAGKILGLSLSIGIIIGGLASLLLVIFAETLAVRVFNSTTLTPEFRISGIILFFTTLNGIQLGALAGLEDFKSIAWVNMMRAGLILACYALGALWGGLIGVMIGLGVANVALFGVTHYFLNRSCARFSICIHWHLDSHELPILYQFSLPSYLTDLLVGGATWFGNTLLVNQVDGYAEMGVFLAAYQWRTAAMFLPAILAQISVPILANLYGAGDQGKFRKVVAGNLGVVFLITALIVVPLLLLSPWIMASYGEGYAEQAHVMVIVMLTVLITSLGGVIGSMMVSMGKLWQLFAINLAWGIGFVAIASMLISQGARGLALSNLISYGLQMLVMFGCLIYYWKQPWNRDKS